MWDVEWLSTGTVEEVLAPDLEIVDTHFHLWTGRPQRLDYPFASFKADTEHGHDITAAVHVEVGWTYRTEGPEHLRPVGETETIASAVEPGRTPVIAGLIGFADLAGEHLPELLDAHAQAGRGLFKGVRQMMAYDEDDRIPQPADRVDPRLMDSDAWRAGLAVLGERTLPFDVWLWHPQIPQLAAAARAVPGTTVVLDHLGSPAAVGRFEGRRDDVLAQWKDSIDELSECPNVVVKIGGIGWPAQGFGRERWVTPPSSQELADAWHPFVSHVLDRFGADRCLAESNFPVDQQTTTYRTLWNAIKRLTGDLTPEDQQRVLAGTARRVYGV